VSEEQPTHTKEDNQAADKIDQIDKYGTVQLFGARPIPRINDDEEPRAALEDRAADLATLVGNEITFHVKSVHQLFRGHARGHTLEFGILTEDGRLLKMSEIFADHLGVRPENGDHYSYQPMFDETGSYRIIALEDAFQRIENTEREV
jgi:hypothetical protein